jgi:hypothetical protein
MDTEQFRADNHYTPGLYLRLFAGSDKKLFTYRTLVQHPKVPLWKPTSVKGVGYITHLYTRIAAGHETDDIEKWLAREFEDPAAEPLQKATSGSPLTTQDWRNLIRFVAAQIVRTPAFFVQNLPRWQADTPRLLHSTIRESIAAVEAAKASGQPVKLPEGGFSDHLPLKVTARIDPGKEMGQLKATMLVGRGMWFFSMRHVLTGPAKILHDHQWSILAPCEGLTWFTSDDPVIRLNYYSEGKYDFKGGWGNKGTEILLPLSPRHLLYTRIGYKPPPRGEALSRAKTEAMRRCIAEHAFRMVFARVLDEDVPNLRPRVVNEGLFRDEQQHWKQWHAEQTAAELKLMNSTQKHPKG